MAIDYNIQSAQPALGVPVDRPAPPVRTPSAAPVERNKSAADGRALPPESAQNSTDPRQVESAVSRISEFVQNLQRDLSFSVDQDSGRMVIKVIDSRTNEVIRQIPSEVVLRLARNLRASDSLILSEQA